MKSFKLTIAITLIFICCSLPFVATKSKAAGNGIEGYMVLVHHRDSTNTIVKNTTSTNEFFSTLMSLKLRGVSCDSIFTFYWSIYFNGDSTDFLQVPALYNQFQYYPPDDIGGCNDMDIYGSTPSNSLSKGGAKSFSGHFLFHAKQDSTVEMVGTAYANDDLNLMVQQQKLNAIPCDSLIWWAWQISLSDGFLADTEGPFPLVTKSLDPDSVMVSGCSAMEMITPF